jgi:hypothetical protein
MDSLTHDAGIDVTCNHRYQGIGRDDWELRAGESSRHVGRKHAYGWGRRRALGIKRRQELTN